jgi:alpha-1,3-glucan synthase
MYIMVDFTVGTMGDMIGFDGYVQVVLSSVILFKPPRFLNSSATFDLNEHDGVWKHPRYSPWGFDKYQDFQVRHTPCVRGN